MDNINYYQLKEIRELFYDLSAVIFHDNIKIEYHEPIKEEIVLTNNYEYESLYNGYYTVIQMPEESNKVLMYYRSSLNNRYISVNNCAKTCLAVSNDGGYSFDKITNNVENNIIFHGSGLSHNFGVCYSKKDKKFYGVGGLHTSKYIPGYNNHEKSPKILLNKRKKLIDPKFNCPMRMNGLYLYNSNDGFQWNSSNEYPILHGFSEGPKDFHGYTKFDGLNSILYDQFRDLYFIYVRYNVYRGSRSIQFCMSRDLKSFSPFKSVILEPEFVKDENFYIPNVSIYPDTNLFVSFPPYYMEKNKSNGIFLLLSRDGYNWKRVNLLLTNEDVFKSRNYIHSVNGIINSPDKTKFFLYYHYNYAGFYSNKPLQIWRYSIRRDGFTSFYSDNGEFIFKMFDPTQTKCKIKLNYHTNKNGYIKVELQDIDRKTLKGYEIENCDKIIGDQLDYVVTWNNRSIIDNIPINLLVRIKLINARIYSVTLFN